MLGKGAYGIVYLAKDTHNGDKLVAIKKQLNQQEMARREGYIKTGIREMSLL